MTPRRATTAQVVAAVRALPTGRTRWVGVDGFGGAGKTTLALALAESVEDAVVVHIDDFWGMNITEWDWDRFRAQVLTPLLAGGSTRYQIWDWSRDAGGDWCDLTPGGVVVVEGVSSTRDELGAPWDLTVWVEAPRTTRLTRAHKRNPDLMSKWLDDWMPSEERYFAAQSPRDRVDFVVDGTRDLGE